MTEADPLRPDAGHASSYAPMVSPEDAERIRQWHESAYQATRAVAGSGQTFSYLGLTLVVPPEVQPIMGMSRLLGEAVLAEVRDSDRVLDMGTGSGVNAILAARAAREVIAVDINPLAVDAARRNARRNHVADRIDIRCSDVFSNVDGRFDLIIFDPPFRWFAPRDLLELASTDENYRGMTSFFRGARQYLTGSGRILISFGTTGDLSYLRKLAADAGFAAEVVAQRELVKDDRHVRYFTFRMTP